MDLAEYSRRIEQTEAFRFRDALVQAALPSIRLTPLPDAPADRLGATRLGGLPDLPEGTTWPTKKGAPLSFIAQVDLATVHEYDSEGLLPESGLLSFFYDAISQSAWGFSPEDRSSFAVLYSSAADTLVRREAPASLAGQGVFRPVALAPGPDTTFVPWASSTLESIGLDDDDDELFDYATVFETPDPTVDASAPIHRLLGYPDHIQGDMQVEAQLATNGIALDPTGYRDPRIGVLTSGAVQWRLLLQVDCDDNTGMTWGDAGRIYYLIRRADLQAGAFDQAWLIFQCC